MRVFKGSGALDTLDTGELLVADVCRHDVNNPGRYTVEWSATDTKPGKGARKGGK